MDKSSIAGPWKRGRRAETLSGCARPGRARPTAGHRTTPEEVEHSLSRGICTFLRRRKCFLRPARNVRPKSGSATESCSCARLQSPGARRRTHCHARPRIARPRRIRKPVNPRRCSNSAVPRARVEKKREMWREGVEQICLNMLAMDPIQTIKANFRKCHAATIVPKSPYSGRIRPSGLPARTARRSNWRHGSGSGALTFAFVDTAEPKLWVDILPASSARNACPSPRESIRTSAW